MPAKGKWSVLTTTEGTCAFPVLHQSYQPQSPPSRPPWPTPAPRVTSRRETETAVWVGVWIVNWRWTGGHRMNDHEACLRMWVVWLRKIIVSGGSLWGGQVAVAGVVARGSMLLGLSGCEFMGGGQADSWGIWRISHENSCCSLRTGPARCPAANVIQHDVVFSAVRCRRVRPPCALQHSRRVLAKINHSMFAQHIHIFDVCLLVSLHLPMQTLMSVSGMNTTVSQASSVSTPWVPSTVSVQMATARLARSALVRIYRSTGVAKYAKPESF